MHESNWLTPKGALISHLNMLERKMGTTENEMRECNEMPVRVIAKVHNPPAAQLWVRICIAIKAGRKASGANLITLRTAQRNRTAPDIYLLSLFSQTFYIQHEASSATSAILYRVSLSQVIYSICLLGY